jgi:hypothetical protein
MTVRGAIVADEQFRSYQITVSPTSRTLTVYSGYLDKKINQINLANNTRAYEEFVYALEKANYVKGTEFTGEKNDRRGVCASGKVYEFATLKANSSVKTLWTTTCGNTKGSLSASISALLSLFMNQIPGGQKVVQSVNL